MEFRKKMISILLLSVLLTAQPVSEPALLNLTSLNVSAAETISRAERLSPEEQEIVITADDPEEDAPEPSAAPGVPEETQPEESPEEIVITADDPGEDILEPSAVPGAPEETRREESPEEIVITADDPEEDAPEPSAAPGVSEETQPEESPEEIVLPEDPLSGGEQPDTELLPEGELPHDSALPPEGELPDAPAVLEEEGATEMLIPVEEGEADTDNDDVFAAYVNREMELTGDLKADTGGVTVTEPRRKSNAASGRLTGSNLTVYAYLLPQIRKVAAGERQDTVFTVSAEELGVDGISWSAEELGVDAIVVYDEASGKYSITSESKSALSRILGISFKTINKALLADCPFDLYWYDKTGTGGGKYKAFNYSAVRIGDEYRLSFSGNCTFSFCVAAEYSVEKTTGTYEVDSSIGSSVREAHDNALAIVEAYSGRTDYEKLDGYRQEICDRVSYNREAAAGSDTPFGNPWQLIWVFDDDPSTNVVCEGYSKGFQYLCDRSSFDDIFRECISVTGTINGAGHMWNIIALRDGRSYMTDLTNCDGSLVGSGLGGRGLFLVGTGDASEDGICAQGSPEEGYSFAKLSGLRYEYDADQADCFGTEILTLAEGRVDENTVADGEYSGSHDHIYLPVKEEAATCEHEGHSAGSQCVICGEFGGDVTIYPLADHTPGEWIVETKPTYTADGTEASQCTVCGKRMTRAVDALVPVDLKAADGKGLVTITVGSAQYTGNTLKPAVRVTCSGTVLKSGTDYTVTYSNSKNAGTNTAKVSVTGKNAYSGSVTKSFSIAKAKQSLTVKAGATAVAVGKTTRLTASGAKETSRYTFTSSNRAVASVDGSGRVTAHKVGTVTITTKVPETSNYQKASGKVTIRVVPAATTKLSAANQADGVRLVWAKVPGASGYDLYRDNLKIRSFAGGNTLVYLDKTANTNGRKYVYRLVAKASTGVSPLSRSVSSWRVTRSMVRTIKSTAPGRAAVTWTKNTHCTGYVIQYALNNGFTSGRKDVTVNSPAAVSRTLTGLLRGRIYYVRIRAFRKVGNLVYSSVWSPARAVKIN